VHLATTNSRDVSSVIFAAFAAELERVTIENNAVEVFSEEVFAFPHTGTFASVLPTRMLQCSEIVILLKTPRGCPPIPFTANAKCIYIAISMAA
jgi:hypothetical protein